MYGPLCSTLMTKTKTLLEPPHPHPTTHTHAEFSGSAPWNMPSYWHKLLMCLSSSTSHKHDKHEKRYVYTLYFSKQTDFRKTVTYTANGT